MQSTIISYLLANSGECLKKDLKTRDELFEHLLIDVEMAPCMITSRIKQAISTVQLFVQRCFMNLEPEVKFDEDAALQWAWMKSYRVWEADRKIFLYPENWIEPELRDDKTPLFQDMEMALAQGQMNNSLAETAIRGYLNGLKDISNLKIVGMYQERKLSDFQWITEKTFTCHQVPIRPVAITPDGHYAVSGYFDCLKVWDLQEGSCIKTLTGHTAPIGSVAVTPDGRYAASGSHDTTLKVWDLQEGSCIKTLTGHIAPIISIAITPDGCCAVSCTKDPSLKFWDLQNGSCINTLTGHTAPIGSVAITPDRRYVILGNNDSMDIFDLQKDFYTKITARLASIRSVAITPDGRYVISGSEDNSLKVWDLQNVPCIKTLTGHIAPIISIAITPDGRYAISGSEDNSLKVWDLQNGSCIKTLTGHIAPIISIAITPDGRYAISGFEVYDLSLRVRDLAGDEGHKKPVITIAITPDSRYAISGSADNSMKVWNLQNGKMIRDLDTKDHNHKDVVRAVAVTPDGRYAVSGSHDTILKVWDLQSGKWIRDLRGHEGYVSAVAITPDGRYAISGSDDKTLKIWDLQSGKWIRDLRGHESYVSGVSITPDGLYAISSSWDGTLKVWNLQNLEWSHDLAAQNHNHTDAVRAVAVTPDGRYAISGSADNTLKVWDLQKKNDNWLSNLAGHTSFVNAVAVSSDGRYAVSASSDNTLKVWSLKKVEIENTHVVARNFAKPIHYYHRDESGGSWTPWKRIDADISGDHVMPAFHNKRLYLFWPIFEEISETEKINNEGKDNLRRYYKISLSFMEYRDGQWSGQHQSAVFIGNKNITEYIYKQQIHDYFFDLVESSTGELRIFVFIKQYVFSWDEIPGNDEVRLRDFLIKKCNIDWVKNANIEKLDNGNTIKLSSGNNALSIKLNDNKDGADLKGNGLGTIELRVKMKNDKLNIYINDNQISNCYRFIDDKEDFIIEDCCESASCNPKPEKSTEFNMGFESSKSNLEISMLKQKNILFNTYFDFSFLTPRQQYLNPEKSEDKFSFFLEDENPDSKRSFLAYMNLGKCKFQTHYHPFVGHMIESLQAYGIDGLLNPREKWMDARDLQRQEIEHEFFDNAYLPSVAVSKPYPVEEIDFSYGGAYSIYNWEIFFQTSFLIAKKLSQEQRFEEAQKWFHYIFDPTSISSDPVPDRFWKVKPFYKMGLTTPLGIVMQYLSKYSGDSSKEIPDTEKLKLVIEEMRMQIEGWRQDPSNPHRIARLRISAYKKSVVMKYLDNLIAWGDYLFRQDTLESINEAIQLYVLAHQILGKRPESIPAQKSKHDMTFIEVREKLDEFSNFIANIENHVCLMGAGEAPLAVPDSEPLHLGPSLFFCIPKNDNLLSYWDTVEDRLYKIRHCMNIEGTERSLALFEPPIDPGQLVRAAAAGAAGAGMIPVTPVALPRYRFQIMLRKAMEFCSQVEGLGNAFLSALEKKDAEGIERLLSDQVRPNLKDIGKNKLDEAKLLWKELDNSEKNFDDIIKKYEGAIKYNIPYSKFFKLGSSIASAGKDIIPEKKDEKSISSKKEGFYENTSNLNEYFDSTKHRKEANIGNAIASGLYGLEAAVGTIPSVIVGVAGPSSPVSLVVGGGSQIKGKASTFARVLEVGSTILNLIADIIDIQQEFQKQKDEWMEKKDKATKEKNCVSDKKKRAELQKDIAEIELKNLDLKEKNAQEIAAYMRSKFTNRELYDWMISQLSTLYFQSYNLAFDMAKQAEKAYQFELGLSNANFVQYGQWDSLKKGLLSGERLKLQLMRMEAAYLENNKREYEITKHISLAAANPAALIELITKGECEVELDEILFDLDYPGQYMRRIKAISLTIDGEIEPYSSVSCKLTMEKNTLRVKSSPSKPYARDTKNEDSRFLDDYACVQSIVTSSGKDDSGMFELDLKDERYLPFEGAGVISKWRIELPNHNPDFQVGSNFIEDVVFNIRYTAREGGNELRDAARKMITDNKDKFMELLKTKGFRQILLVENVQASNPLNINSPKIAGIKEFSVEQVDLFIIVTENTDLKARLGEHIIEFKETYGDLRHSHISNPGDLSNCKIEFTEEGFDLKKVKYMAIMLKYKVLD